MSDMIETNNTKVLNHGNDSSQAYGGEELDSSLAGLPNSSAGHKIKSVTAELEKRRAELIALARAAEIRAREAEEKCEQIESKLELEANQRLVAEERLRDLEDERLRQQQAAEMESVKTLKAALEQEREEVEETLREAERRITVAETKAEELTVALAEAERRRAEAENLAQVARDDAREIESLFAGAETRLKEVENRLVEAEASAMEEKAKASEERARALEEIEARKEAENALIEFQSQDEAAAQARANAEIATMALTEANQKLAEAEAMARSVEERFQQSEFRLTQELDQRSLLEQLLRELEEKSKEQLKERETKELELYDALLFREEAEARLKEAETRLLDAGSTSVALDESNQQRIEAEAAARAMEEKARKIEALLIEAEAVAHEATEGHKAAEAKLQYEIKQRAVAEQKLKEFEDELSNYLELDWSKSEPEAAPQQQQQQQPSVAIDGFVTNEHTSQLLAQVEIERKAKQEAEEARAAIELRIWEMERELSDAEERHRQQEDELRELLRRQEAKQSAMPEWAAVPESKFSTLGMSKSAEDANTYSLKRQKGFSYELKFIIYGIVITSLLAAAGWLITELFLRI